MQKVFGIWNTRYHLPKKYLEKYLNAHKLTLFGILFKYQFLSIWPNTGPQTDQQCSQTSAVMYDRSVTNWTCQSGIYQQQKQQQQQ